MSKMLLNLVDQAKKTIIIFDHGYMSTKFLFLSFMSYVKQINIDFFFLFISTYYKSEIAKNTIRVLCVVMANIKGNSKSALLFRIAILFFIFFKFKECILIFLFFFCKYTLKHLYVHFL